MEIELLIRKKKEIYSSLMQFIDDTENDDINWLIKNFEQHEILKDKEEILSIILLLNRISYDHHRFPDLFSKIIKIIKYLIQGKIHQIPDLDLYERFKYNKLILLLLLEERIIQPDEKIISDIKKTNDNNGFPHIHYLYSGIKSFLNADETVKIEQEIKEKYGYEISEFEKKCRIGENDSFICQLIRQDAVEEFISYVNRTKTSLLSQIQPSIFESNSLFFFTKPTLIEYASFFGSIQIIQYLRYSNVPLTTSLWIYTIHSNNAELIHFLEENVNNQTTNYEKVFSESIKCHHNDIADYIKDNYLDLKQIDNCAYSIILFHNFYYFPVDIGYLISNSNKIDGFNVARLCFKLKKITIPSSVTWIGNYAFNECSSLTQITIPSSVTSIGNYAFNECSSLKKIIIPTSVTSIGNFAFCGCSSLTQITISSSVKSIGDFVFLGCSSLKQIEIPSSVTSIGNYSFCRCSVLERILIPTSITSIGEGAFSGCSSLTEISIPTSVTSIGRGVFYGCSSLQQITILSSVNKISQFSFENIDKDFYWDEITFIEELKNIKYMSNSTVYISDLPTNDNEYPPSCLIDEYFLKLFFTEYHISSDPDSVIINTKIRKDGTAYSYSYIKFETEEEAKLATTELNYLKINNIPIRMTLMNEKDEYKIHNNITDILITIKNLDPDIEVSQIHDAFSNFGEIISVKIPTSTNGIIYGLICFSNQEDAKQTVFDLEGAKLMDRPVEVKPITINIDMLNNEGLFEGCSSLTHVSIPSSVTSIEDNEFKGCSSLKQIIIPSSVTSIGMNAFFGCSSLTQISIPSSVTSIGINAFCECSSLTQISIPSSVTSIGKGSFYGCTSLTQISIPLTINRKDIKIPSKTKILTI